MKVAIVHDHLVQRGGGERVVLSLHRMFPEAPVYTSFYDPDATFPEFRELDVRPSFLQRLPHSGNKFRAYLPLFPAAISRMNLDAFDLIISNSSGWSHGAHSDRAFHVCYCLAPAKWLYRTDDYLGAMNSVPAPARPLLKPVFSALRRWDRRVARRPDVYIAISRHVVTEIKRAYGRDSTIVYPPVSVERFAGAEEPPGGYYLVVSRPLPYKRVDLAIAACEKREARLIVVGEGPERAALMERAGSNVTFHKSVDDAELVRLYAGATALLQCGKEDFGIVPLEANAAGRPAVAFAGGGALDTVVDGETGILFDAQDEASLSHALDRLEARSWDAAVLRKHAARFSEDRFIAEMRATIDAAMRREPS